VKNLSECKKLNKLIFIPELDHELCEVIKKHQFQSKITDFVITFDQKPMFHFIKSQFYKTVENFGLVIP